MVSYHRAHTIIHEQDYNTLTAQYKYIYIHYTGRDMRAGIVYSIVWCIDIGGSAKEVARRVITAENCMKKRDTIEWPIVTKNTV